MKEKQQPDDWPGLLEKLQALITAEIISRQQLANFLNGVEKKNKIKKSKEISEVFKSTVFPTAVSYLTSQKIWQVDILEQEPELAYLHIDRNSVFKDPKFNWQLVWLNGLSIAEIIQRFPDMQIEMEWLKRYDWFKTKSLPGYYLISWLNPLINLSDDKEKSLIPDDCQRLPGNLILEFLINWRELNKSIDVKLYFRTNFQNAHDIDMCIGKKNGHSSSQVPVVPRPFIFTSATGGKYKHRIGLCLMRDRDHYLE